MLAIIIAPMRRIAQSLLACSTPSELAAGFTLGMIVGVVPKGNLVALSLCVLLFSLRVNKATALAAAIAFSCVAAWADPFTHKLGLTVLTTAPLQTCYASVHNLPLGPWIGFSNTVMVGSLLAAVYSAYPVYWITRVVAQKSQLAIATQLNGYRCEAPPLCAEAAVQPGATP